MRRMVYLSLVCFGLWILAMLCVMPRMSNIQIENASFWNAACLVGVFLFGYPALFLTFLLHAGWKIAFVAWVWNSEAFPVRIVHEREPSTEPGPSPVRDPGHRWLG